MQGRMQNILKHARQPSTANKENKTSSPASASTGTTIGPLNAKDEASMAHIAVEWTKIDQLSDEKTELASRLDRLVTRHRERGRDEWRKIAGDEAVEEFDAANPDWPSDGLAAAVAGSLAGTPGAMQHLNGLLSAGGSAGLMMTGGLGSFSATAGSFRTGISTAGLSPLAMDDKMMKKRKANADGSISGYFTNMGPPPVPGYVMAGGSGSTLPHGQGHVHAAAQLPSLHHSGQSAHPMSPGWAINQASQSGRGQYGHGQSNKRRVQSMDLDDSFVMTTEMAEGEADAEEAADNNIYCTCREKSWGEMIGCDNPDCPMEWVSPRLIFRFTPSVDIIQQLN